LPAASPSGLSAQPSLHPVPKLLTDYSLVLTWIALLLVANLAPVQRIREQAIERPARERPGSASAPVLRSLDRRDHPELLEVLPQQPYRAQFEIPIENVFDQVGFLVIDQ
jgi:hypothetical protein